LALGLTATAPGPVSAAASAAPGPSPAPPSRHLAASQQTPTAKGLLPKRGSYAFLLELDTASTFSRFRSVRASGTKKAATKAAAAQLDTVRTAQQRVEQQLSSLHGHTSVLFGTHAVLAGVAVRTDVANAPALARLPGVKAVYPIAPKKPDNSYAVPFQGAPAAWGPAGGGQTLGQGVTVVDIDTGLDYTHADFGGPGTKAAYNCAHQNDTLAVDEAQDQCQLGDLYDPAKFDAADSWDFAGDAYDADSGTTPAPDPNPLDCSSAGGGDGHGSHTAGTIAGYGVAADGSTYHGPYDASTVNTAGTSAWKIGPGMAPEATLVSYRIFGCSGSTDLVSAAIDRAVDLNNDGAPDGGRVVVNLSVGADFGTADDGDAVEADKAAAAGVTMVVAAGNAGDAYDAGGSPGTAPRVITVAASEDAQTVDQGASYTIASGTPQEMSISRSTAYDWLDDPDLTGAVAAMPADNASACKPLSSADRTAIAGKVALITWDEDAIDAGSPPADACGSSDRVDRLENGGAVGVVFADTDDTATYDITGNADVPAILIERSDADAIRAALGQGKSVEIAGTTTDGPTIVDAADDDKVPAYSSRGSRGAGDLKPDVTAVGDTVFSVLPGSGNRGQDMSGTSMATPMVAGLAALTLDKHPAWSPEQVKADVMNTADHDLYVDGASDQASGSCAPMRVGAGRIDAAAALTNDVLAYDADDAGTVSVSFGSLAVTATTTLTKHVTVQNTGTASATYAVDYQAATSVPGVSVSVSPSTVTLAPGGSPGDTRTVTVTLHVDDPQALANGEASTPWWDPTHAADDGGLPVDPTIGAPVDVLAEASGTVVLAPDHDNAAAAATTLRVPVYAAPRPAAQMSQPGSLAIDGSATLPLQGHDFGWSGSDPVRSVAAGFELQATSPALQPCDAGQTSGCLRVSEDSGADIKDVGTTSAGDFLYVAIATQGPHRTPASAVEFDIYLDTSGDGAPDLVAYDTRLGTSDVFLEELVDLNQVDPTTGQSGVVVDDELLTGAALGIDTAVYDSDVLVAPISLADTFTDSAGDVTGYGLGHYLQGSSTLRYAVSSFTSSGDGEVDEVGWSGATTVSIPVDIAHPALTVTDGSGLASPYVADRSGNVLTVTRNATSYAADGGLGLLLVHFHNVVGDKAQVVALAAPGVPPVVGPAQRIRPTVVLKVRHHARAGKLLKVKVRVRSVNGIVATGRVRLKGAGAHHAAKLRHGKAVFTIRPKRGRLHLKAMYGGDATYLSGHSPKRTVRVG
jgi:subtilisin family serine protease